VIDAAESIQVIGAHTNEIFHSGRYFGSNFGKGIVRINDSLKFGRHDTAQRTFRISTGNGRTVCPNPMGDVIANRIRETLQLRAQFRAKVLVALLTQTLGKLTHSVCQVGGIVTQATSCLKEPVSRKSFVDESAGLRVVGKCNNSVCGKRLLEE
jgi:hypothetical protein